jgi:DnaJ-class molecular chaperone
MLSAGTTFRLTAKSCAKLAWRGAALRDDHYAVLGVGSTVGMTEIRRAYRQLALRHHPDRAGAAATAHFQRIVEAYRVLSDPTARSSYDADRRAAPPLGRSAPAPRPAGAPPVDNLLVRVSGSLDTLLARRIARHGPPGVIDLHLTPDEARSGGTAAIWVTLQVPCPTCGGVASPGRVWCQRCEFEGAVMDQVTLYLPIPPYVPDGATFGLNLGRPGDGPALAVRIRV